MSSEGTKEPVSAAERMRGYRARRRNGLHYVRILLHETEIDSLIGKGFLEQERRHDPNASEGLARETNPPKRENQLTAA